MRKSFNFLNFCCVITLTILVSCQQDLDTIQFQGKITFSIDGVKNTLGKAAKNNLEDARYILVTIAKSNGEIVVNQKKLSVYKFNGNFISEPLDLNPGNYQLLDFLILDTDDQVLFASPMEDSELASLVRKPLPIDFEVLQDDTVRLIPEIVNAEGTAAEAFGYVTFSFNLVDSWDFLLSIFAYAEESNNLELTEAELTVLSSDGDTLQVDELEAKTNAVKLLQENDIYTLIVNKPGYKSYRQTLSFDELQAYKDEPLTVVLDEGNILIFQPGPEEGKDAITGSIIPDANRGDINHFSAYAWTHNGIRNVHHNFIDFNVNHIVDQADQIDQAYLYLYYAPIFPAHEPFSTHTGDNAMYIYRITSPWEELEVTWNTQPTIDDRVRVLVPASTANTQDYKIDVTNLVKEMVTNPENSHGFFIRLVDETPYSIVVLASSDYEDSSKRPKLEIIKKQ